MMFSHFSCVLKGKEAPNIKNLQGQGPLGGGFTRAVSGENLYVYAFFSGPDTKHLFSRTFETFLGRDDWSPRVCRSNPITNPIPHFMP